MTTPSAPRPAIALQELAKSVYDAWLNSPQNHRKGQPRNVVFTNACFLSYVLHHAVVEAASQGLDVTVKVPAPSPEGSASDAAASKADGKTAAATTIAVPIILSGVVDGAAKSRGSPGHSWNIFQTAANGMFAVDLSCEQYDAASLTTTDSPFVPVPGKTRVIDGVLFRTAEGSRDWVGRGMLIAGETANPAELAARRDLWPFYLATLIAAATRVPPKKWPPVPQHLELHPDALTVRQDAATLGDAAACSPVAKEEHIDSFRFMLTKHKGIKSLCARRAGAASSSAESAAAAAADAATSTAE